MKAQKKDCSRVCARKRGSGWGQAGDLQRHGSHLFVDQPVGGENDGAAKLVRIPGEIAHFAASFFDQQDARGRVPFLQAKFPEAVEAAGSNGGEVQRGGAVSAHAVRVLREVAVELKIRAGLAVAHRKAGAEQACRERGVLGNSHFLAVERGAFAARGGEQFIVKRIEDHGGEKRIPLGESDRNAEAGIPMGEIRGAVERVDVPAKLRSQSALMPRSLLGGYRVVWKVF